MKKIGIVMVMLATVTMAGQAIAAPCRDAKGHFIKCAAATAPVAPAQRATTSHAAAMPAHAAPAQRCRNGKGQFAKCGTAGAKGT